MDLSSQESSPALPGVTSSLLVSIKDDELETEGEEGCSTNGEDGGHKNDKVNSVSALMGDASREGGKKEEHEIFKRGFPCCSLSFAGQENCVSVSDKSQSISKSNTQTILLGISWRWYSFASDRFKNKGDIKETDRSHRSKSRSNQLIMNRFLNA